ncbi:hypothetical protein CU098_002625, partial [Rhizopus stolonifer]
FVLVNFYCSRLTDQATVPSLMPGLAILTSKFDHLNANCTKVILQSLVHQVQIQSFPHITRNAAIQVFENLLDYHCKDVKAMTDEFISGFIQSITGEKDPRNLITVYATILKMVNSLDISNHVEDLFDATFCYFPITFRPPPDNPYGITAKDLKLSLRKCMASTSLFSKYAIPLLLKKLSTMSGSAKKDAMETLTACASVYPVHELILVGTRLFDSIKIEILSGEPDPGLREPSLDAITALTKAITTSEAVKEADVTRVLKSLIDDCVLLLDELDEDSVKPASLVLRAIASASPFAYALIENTVLPKLLRLYRENKGISERYFILCTMVAIIQARKIVYDVVSENDEDEENVHHDSVLVSYKTRMIENFTLAIKERNEHPEFRLMGILGLGLLCVLRRYMKREQRALCVQTLGSVLEAEEEEKLRSSVEMSLLEISHFDPLLIKDITMPMLISILPDFSSMDDKSNLVSHKLTLKTIQKICCPTPIYNAVEQKLLTKFIYICSHNKDRKYALEVARTLLLLLETRNNEKQKDIHLCADTLLPSLISSIESAVMDSSSIKDQVIILNPEVLQAINLIILIVMRNMKTEEQRSYVDKYFKHFKQENLFDKTDFCPLSSNAPEAQAACTQLFATIISSMRKDTSLPTESNQAFLDPMIEEALKSTFQTQIIAFCRIIASVINKWTQADALDSYINYLKKRLENLVQDEKSSSALTIYVWVAKALVMRYRKNGIEMTDMILQWIRDTKLGRQASNSFDILIGDDPLCLNNQCFAVISLLYKQKFMNYALPKLLSTFNNASTKDEKSNYLVAIAYLLKNVPRSILMNQLPPLVPLLIESLSFPDTTLKLSTLNMFQFALCEATDIVSKHIITLLPSFISLTRPEENPMQVRIAALKCIGLVATKVSHTITLPYVKSTLKAIALPLDDKKRLVRKQAVECRESWYLINAK